MLKVKIDKRRWPENIWPRCSDCGKIAACTDVLAFASFQSVRIEKPGLEKVLCGCERWPFSDEQKVEQSVDHSTVA